jgi:hypothetical protein
MKTKWTNLLSMKKIRLLFVSLMLSLSAFGHDPNMAPEGDFVSFLAKSPLIRNFGLYFIVSSRCAGYLPYDKAELCKYNVARLIDVLDYDVIFDESLKDPQSYVFIAFKRNLVEILSEPSTSDYLNKLNQHLNDYLLQKNPNFNIWDFTVNYYGNKVYASKVLAALFQDTSLKKLHLAYLDKSGERGRLKFTQNKELLNKSIDTINLIIDYSEKNFLFIFYPRQIRGGLNRSIYHFYVPLYASLALKDRYAPLFLTLSYEFITTAHDYRYLFIDPETLDPEKEQWKIRDIYAAYRATKFAHGANFVDFESIKNEFGRSTNNAVQLMLK